MKLRFAPSPTGFLHVGGARTAIFNLLHARHHGGTLLLRIEDTDVERSRQHHAEQIISSLAWMGVEYDEGPIYQSDRLDRYSERAAELVEKGLAYRCICSVEDLERERAEAEKGGKPYRYSGRCRAAAERGESLKGKSFVVRFRVPAGPIQFDDLIRGTVRFEGETIDDFVILRSDGYPTYHLSVVVDDIDMGVTLVARGDDHLSNTPKHILLFRAFGSEPPEFAHLPLILGSDRKRLSKRTGATSAEEYREMGILPQVLFNFLMLLGWAPGDDREIISRNEAISLFDLRDVNKAPAVFDPEKLLWMNGQYLMKMAPEEIFPHLEPFLNVSVERGAKLDQVIRLYQPRARTLRELADRIAPYFSDDDSVQYEDEAVRKHLGSEDVKERMGELYERLAATEPFDVQTAERELRALAELRGIGAGKYIHPLRVALLGTTASPPIFDVAVALGRESTIRRLRRLIEQLPF